MNSIYLLIGVLIGGFGIIIYLINKRLKTPPPDKALLEWIKSTQASVEQTNKTLHEVMQSTNININRTLQANTQALNERLDNAAKVIAGVQKDIGEMSEIGRGMKDFQELLRSPKLRGNIGEQVLKELLGQMLPKSSFHLQYSFKSGSIVDAAIKTEAGIIPIDSKFPMENFRKMNHAKTDTDKAVAEKDFISDVKKHVDAISKKYILTHEGTIDYALMYVPSEAIYYEIVNNTTLFDYASKHRVLPVSPMTFYAYLKAILMGFEGQKVSQKAREILSGIKAIQKEYENLTESVDTLSKHITNSYNMMNHVQAKTVKLGQKIQSTSLSSIEETPLLDNESFS
jgi:DNA recombination protein RmuC